MGKVKRYKVVRRVKRLTELERKRMVKAYDRREAVNYHRENAGMLIKRFGTVNEKKKYKQISRLHVKQGSLTWAQSKWLTKHGHKKFSKIAKPIK